MFVFVLECITRYVLSGFAIILTRKRELVALLLLFFGCLVTVNVLWLFLMVMWVGLQFVVCAYHILLRLALFSESAIWPCISSINRGMPVDGYYADGITLPDGVDQHNTSNRLCRCCNARIQGDLKLS